MSVMDTINDEFTDLTASNAKLSADLEKAKEENKKLRGSGTYEDLVESGEVAKKEAARAQIECDNEERKAAEAEAKVEVSNVTTKSTAPYHERRRLVRR